MPRVLRTVIPRIKKSLAERGLMVTLSRSVLLPLHLVREIRDTKQLVRTQSRSDFDLAYKVDTDGDFGDWTYLSDLDIQSPNWIYGNDYCAIEPERLTAILSALNIAFEDFVFIDFGSGKGRALLIAAEFPFKAVVGVEFCAELHAIAKRNLQNYRNPRQLCASVDSVCLDFVDFVLPCEPAVLFFFDPCAEGILSRVLSNIHRSAVACPREIYLIYVAPGTKQRLLDSADFLSKIHRDEQRNCCVYKVKSVYP